MDSPTKSSPRQRTVLTERDNAILLALYKHRYLSAAQVQRLFFPSLQTAHRRIRQLARAGLVGTFRSPGVPGLIAFLTPRGVASVAASLGATATELVATRTRPKDHYFLRHFLAVNDFRIALTRACAARDDVSLLGFFADHVGERTDRDVLRRYLRDVAADVQAPGAEIGHTPDGVFALQFGDAAALFFLEVDRGTESVSHRDRGVAKILRFYLSYLASGGHRRYEQVFGVPAFRSVRVLIVTSSHRRLMNIRAVGASLAFEPSSLLRIIWLAEIAAIEGAVLSLPWVSLDPGDPAMYRILRDQESVVSAGGALARD